MNMNTLFEMQRGLDSYIEKEHNLEGTNLFDQKVLALLVEIGELANETRCFKFWSTKGPSERGIILEEFVDGVHFILSLGILADLTDAVPASQQPAKTATDQFLLVTEAVHTFHRDKAKEAYQSLLDRFFTLGDMLGFSAEEVEQAYIAKNEVNYKRQQSGY
ncbi:dUTP diphosphatase [Domibacillus sp. DTU_2020_1001157_1_SI_ALB_TIR_016]|uniref:dUTP diphosphatase n=1 Tax=Domibacillus sp. DTU_2020_1001157_1_SI_ALB_TIR_016 TaxID=3077789 RepID=UPI0028E5A8A6|nr:dUTP diphosphatase [Domibacillus sp. DTU_2020_1001157_1_SI_ALB_TIR_016]WNS81762.1 dUTP diphosphatase [Domibacillus sp. DTU_2020_1001157_1_SI_ALB_TIR_016]